MNYYWRHTSTPLDVFGGVILKYTQGQKQLNKRRQDANQFNHSLTKKHDNSEHE